jgi:GMP synthase PP-ATPase subunit
MIIIKHDKKIGTLRSLIKIKVKKIKMQNKNKAVLSPLSNIIDPERKRKKIIIYFLYNKFL